MQAAAFLTSDQKTTGTNVFVTQPQFSLVTNEDHKAWQNKLLPWAV